jgi:Right handed beta helix region/Protein of unknown function (DUF1565)
MRIYVNGRSAFTVRGSRLNTLVPLSKGSYWVVVQAWDNHGTAYKDVMSLLVKSTAPAPSPTPPPRSPSPAPEPQGGNYVAPGGNDSNDGSASAPWATLQHAADMAQPGSVIHVAPGTYGPVTSNASGTATARIRFVSDVKWGAKVRAYGIDQVWLNNGNYVDIMGFDVSGDGRLGILNEGSHVRVIGNLIHDIPAIRNAGGGNGGAGIVHDNYSGGDNDTIGNVVHDIGNPAVADLNVHGIYHSNYGGHISNNMVYRNQAWGISLWHAANAVVISNNLVFQNGEGGIEVGAGDTPGGVTANNTLVTNNLIVDHRSSWGDGIPIDEFGATGTSNRYENNMIWNNNGPITLQNGLADQNTINADPLFVNYQANGSGDYHPNQGSRAINAATTLGLPAEDFDGAPRPFGSGPDIGPYEMGATPAPWPWM